MEAKEMMRTLGNIAYWALIALIAMLVEKYSGPRDDIKILTYAVVVMAAVLIQWIIKLRQDQKSKAKLEEENNTFVLSMMWSIMRRSLVSDHDRYCYEYGNVNDTQRSVWMSDYDSYEILCEKLGKHNGVMDHYRDDVLNLPDHKEHGNYSITNPSAGR